MQQYFDQIAYKYSLATKRVKIEHNPNTNNAIFSNQLTILLATVQLYTKQIFDAGSKEFQVSQVATKKLKHIVDQLMEYSKLASEDLVNEAFMSLELYITTLLKNQRWQDVNIAIRTIIFLMLSQCSHNLDSLINLFIVNIHIYLAECEEIIQKSCLDLFKVLLNHKKLNEQQLIQCQSQLIDQVDQLLIENPNSISYLAQLQDVLLIEVIQNDVEMCYENKYYSKVDLNAFLTLISMLLPKTQQYSLGPILHKCVQTTQKHTRLQAITILNNYDQQIQYDNYIELLEVCLYDDYLEVRKIATLLAKKVIMSLEGESRYNVEKRIVPFMFFNQQFQSVTEMSADIRIFFEKEIPKIRLHIIEDNFISIANICSIQLFNHQTEVRKAAIITYSKLVSPNKEHQQLLDINNQWIDFIFKLIQQEEQKEILHYCWTCVQQINLFTENLLISKCDQITKALQQTVGKANGIPISKPFWFFINKFTDEFLLTVEQCPSRIQLDFLVGNLIVENMKSTQGQVKSDIANSNFTLAKQLLMICLNNQSIDDQVGVKMKEIPRDMLIKFLEYDGVIKLIRDNALMNKVMEDIVGKQTISKIK